MNAPTLSEPDNKAQLRRVLNLVVDAAIAADDALQRDDEDELEKALVALSGNVETVRKLAAATRREARA